MKCIKNIITGEVKRVSDDRAMESLTKSWFFVPKSEWKQSANTTWRKNADVDQPMSQSKKRRQEMKEYRPDPK